MSQVTKVGEPAPRGGAGSAHAHESPPLGIAAVCSVRAGKGCRLTGARCTSCSTPRDVVAKVGQRAGERRVATAATGITALPPRLPSLPDGAAGGALLADRVSRYLTQLSEFEKIHERLLTIPLIATKGVLREQYSRFTAQLRDVHDLETTYEALTRDVSVSKAVPLQHAALSAAKERLQRMQRSSRLLINYFDTLLTIVGKAGSTERAVLDTRTQELAVRVFRGHREKRLTTLTGSRHYTLRVLEYGSGFEVVDKALPDVPTRVARAADMARRALENEITILTRLEGAPHVIPHFFARLRTTTPRVFLARADHDFQYQIFKKGITKSELRRFLTGTLRGLQSIHAKKIVHHDLKLENILIIGKDAYIADFGAARPEGTLPFSGTIYYVSPERLGEHPPTSKSDIWSFGITCYVALTGRYPFSADAVRKGRLFSSQAYISAALTAGLRTEKERVSILDPTGKLQEVVTLALHVTPSSRPSAEDLLHHVYFTK